MTALNKFSRMMKVAIFELGDQKVGLVSYEKY